MEPGQNRKIAALTFIIHVHHFYYKINHTNVRGVFMNKYMNLALKESKKAFISNDIPVGAVIVKNNKVIAKAYNKKNKSNLIIDHAEIIAITKANKKINNWRLDDCDIYVTLFPCPMCASAIKQSRIKNVYYCIKQTDSKSEKDSLNILDGINLIYLDNYKDAENTFNEFFKKIRNK